MKIPGIDIKNCPFCGGEPMFVADKQEVFIECENCRARGPMLRFDDFPEDEMKWGEKIGLVVIDLWNSVQR